VDFCAGRERASRRRGLDGARTDRTARERAGRAQERAEGAGAARVLVLVLVLVLRW
jgi:hypothetical protein